MFKVFFCFLGEVDIFFEFFCGDFLSFRLLFEGFLFFWSIGFSKFLLFMCNINFFALMEDDIRFFFSFFVFRCFILIIFCEMFFCFDIFGFLFFSRELLSLGLRGVEGVFLCDIIFFFGLEWIKVCFCFFFFRVFIFNIIYKNNWYIYIIFILICFKIICILFKYLVNYNY